MKLWPDSNGNHTEVLQVVLKNSEGKYYAGVDNDGKGLWNTRMGHGDAMHLMGFFPDSDLLQVWDVHENRRDGSTLVQAATGEVIFQIPSNADVGRGMAADIDPTNYGVEMWSSTSGGILNLKGEVIAPAFISTNFAVWWTGDLNRELLDGARISKYNPATKRADVIMDMSRECSFNNGTKSNPCLEVDLLGDWREEVIVRTRRSDELRIYVTDYTTPYRFYTLMQDIPYHLSVATQNVAYNQPSELGCYFGPDLKKGKVFRGCVVK